MRKLTDRAIQAAKAVDKRRDIPDGVVPGLILRVHPTGKKSFALVGRFPGSPHSTRRSLGAYGVISLAEARDKARQWLKLMARGKDPAHEIERERAADLHETIARKFASLAKQGVTPQAYLYRHYGPNGDLLYVGQSMSAWSRNAWHLTKSSWRDVIWLIVIEPFATREEALAAEEEAIRSEYPKHNITHNRNRHPFREIERAAKHDATKNGTSFQ